MEITNSPIDIDGAAVEVDGERYQAVHVYLNWERDLIHNERYQIYGLPELYGEIKWSKGADFERPMTDGGWPEVVYVIIDGIERSKIEVEDAMFASDTEFIATK